MNLRNALSFIALLCTCASLAPAATLRVPQDYGKVQDAVSASSSGDVIEISSGTYVTWYGWAEIGVNNLTLRGVGPTRPIVDCRHGANAQKGCYLIDGNNITIDNIEIMNCRLADSDGGNGSGIRLQGGSATVRNCYIHDCDDGIMGGSNSSATILVEYCEFYNCGSFPGMASYGYTHNLYIGNNGTFTMRYCYSHGAQEGHTVKTRANVNNIYYNLLTSEDSNSSRELQFAQGGTCYAIGNVIIQGPNSANSEIVAYGGEGTNANPYLYIVNNTLINERAGGAVFLSVTNPPTQAVFKNNVIQQLGGETIVGGSNGSKVTQATNWITTNAHFRNPANHNYRLTAASIGALDAGSAPGTGYNSVSLVPVYQYVFPYANQARPTNGTIDIGAYEYTPNAAPVVDAGPDQNVLEGQPINLHATASDFDCDPLTYTWTQPAGMNIVLTGTATANASFTAPTVSTIAQAAMTFTVTVSDGQGGVTSDSVNVRVRIPGDVNQDNSVDVIDLLTFVAAFGSVSGDSNYDPTCDFNGDGGVDVVDLITMVDNWGRTLN